MLFQESIVQSGILEVDSWHVQTRSIPVPHRNKRDTRRPAPWLRLILGLAISAVAGVGWIHAAEPTGDLAKPLARVQFELYAKAPGYSEGPTWRRGELFFCSGALLRVDAQCKVHKYFDLNPAGTVLRGDGHLLVCDNKHKALLDVSPDGKVGVVAEQLGLQTLRSLNDLTIDARGNVYWTDPEGSTLKTPVGSIFRVRPDGRVDRIATGLAFPNGLDVDPAGKFLYVIESQSKKILRYPVPADNDLLGTPDVFYDLGGSGGDGCAFDAQGNLWVADFHRPETSKGRITVLSPEAKVLAYLPVPAKVVSNIAFGGPEHDEIFCTTGDPPGVFHARVGVKGFAGHPGKRLPIVRDLNVVALREHPDAVTLGKIAKIAADAKIEGGKPDAASMGKAQELVRGLTDPQVSADVLKLMPLWQAAAVRYARDRVLLAEIKRLGGKATIEVQAPAWLRSVVGDEGLQAFGRHRRDRPERTDRRSQETDPQETLRARDRRLVEEHRRSSGAATSGTLRHRGHQRRARPSQIPHKPGTT